MLALVGGVELCPGTDQLLYDLLCSYASSRAGYVQGCVTIRVTNLGRGEDRSEAERVEILP